MQSEFIFFKYLEKDSQKFDERDANAQSVFVLLSKQDEYFSFMF